MKMRFADISQISQPGYQVDHLLSMLPKTIKEYQEESLCPLNMEPDFQRIHVWTTEQQTRYVEFLLRGGNSSRDIYLNCHGWMGSWEGPFELVDGKQRLKACLDFMDGTVPIFDGLLIDDFTDKPHFCSTLRFHINNLKTRKQVLQWYLDLNDGGVIHTADELSKVRQLLKKESSN